MTDTIFEKACTDIQKAIQEFVDNTTSDAPQNEVVDILGGCIASVFFEFYNEDCKDDFLAGMNDRFEHVLSSLKEDDFNDSEMVKYSANSSNTIH